MFTLADKIWIKIKSAFRRITLTRFTLAFFLFSFFHCFAQGIIQSLLFTVDASYSTLVSNILHDAHSPPNEFAWLRRPDGGYRLELCAHVPGGALEKEHPCVLIFESGHETNASGSYKRSVDEFSIARNVALVRDESSSSLSTAPTTVTFAGLTIPNEECLNILVYPSQVLANAKREDMTFVALQFWLFSISFIAIMYDSVPHTLAVLCARVLVTGWSAYTIWRTLDIQERFQNLVANPDSPCHSDMFNGYSKARAVFEKPDLVLNLTALALSAYLSWHLVKTYKDLTFRCLGPPRRILRIYKFFMAIMVCLQLSVFILMGAMALWIDQLVNGAIATISSHTTIYQALFIVTTIFLLPWITTGWYAIRQENKHMMTAFLIGGFIFISGWAIMFYSLVYRWTFLQWPLLACLTLESYIVLVASLILGALCWRDFNTGLSQFLHAEERLASLDFEPELFKRDIEKGPFPDKSETTPTFFVPSLQNLQSGHSDRSLPLEEFKTPPGLDSTE